MTRLLLICLGGAVGTGARYLLAVWAGRVFAPPFPLATLVVNVVGSFLVAVVMQMSLDSDVITADARLVIATGILGGFTTYSTFNYETLALLRTGAWTLGVTYAFATFAGCFAAGVAGLALGHALTH